MHAITRHVKHRQSKNIIKKQSIFEQGYHSSVEKLFQRDKYFPFFEQVVNSEMSPGDYYYLLFCHYYYLGLDLRNQICLQIIKLPILTRKKNSIYHEINAECTNMKIADHLSKRKEIQPIGNDERQFQTGKQVFGITEANQHK